MIRTLICAALLLPTALTAQETTQDTPAAVGKYRASD